MKKPFSPSRFDKSGGGNYSRQNNDGGAEPNGNVRHFSKKVDQQSVDMWMQSTSSSLTSHIPMQNKKHRGNSGGNFYKKFDGRNNNRPQGKFKPYEKFKDGNTGGFRGHKPGGFRRQDSGKPHVPEDTSAPVTLSDEEKNMIGGVDAFKLFCAYHLGIGPNKEYRPSNINEVSKRFGVSPAVIRQALKDHRMDSGALLEREFDMAMAQLDIQVAPEGIDRVELAKTIYEDFLQAPVVKRDWNKILEEDRKENQKVFGK